MANEEQLEVLRQGPEAWNAWRREHLGGGVFVELSGADLCRANLREADLYMAILRGADLRGAKLVWTNLRGAILGEANLRGADLSGVHLQGALLVGTCLANADLTGCYVHGISAWDLNLEGTTQKDLIITKPDEPEITVDNLEVAQFVYLLLHSERIRHVIDTITSKVVLILGRFTPERQAVLDALREELRRRDYLPVLFDFEGPESRDITETISLLARMARFVIADLTDAKSIPPELAVIVPNLPSVPVQPLLLEGSGEYGMFEHFRRYPWVLAIHRYASPARLIAEIGERVLAPAEAKAQELRAG